MVGMVLRWRGHIGKKADRVMSIQKKTYQGLETLSRLEPPCHAAVSVVVRPVEGLVVTISVVYL